MDTCTRSGLDPKTSTHPTQGSIPFSATQSLGLCLSFQCCSRCAKKKTIPSRSICEVPSYTRFIKLVQIQFHSKLVHTKEKYTHIEKHNVNTTKHASTHSVTEETIVHSTQGTTDEKLSTKHGSTKKNRMNVQHTSIELNSE